MTPLLWLVAGTVLFTLSLALPLVLAFPLRVRRACHSIDHIAARYLQVPDDLRRP